MPILELCPPVRSLCKEEEYLRPQPPTAEAGRHIHIIKGVSCALVLTCWNFATSNACQKQSNGNASWVYHIHSSRFSFWQCHAKRLTEESIYTFVGLSSLLVSTSRAMRRPQHVERVTGPAPRFFCLYAYHIFIDRQDGAIGKK